MHILFKKLLFILPRKKRNNSSGSSAGSDNRSVDSPMTSSNGASSIDGMVGLLRVKILRGINLAVRDVRSSDPYVIMKMGKQKLKTRVINKDVNPEWNEELTLSIFDPNLPVQLVVYDHDKFTKDDRMGEAEFDIKPFMEALKKNGDDRASGTIISSVKPCRNNCLSEESHVVWDDKGKILQNMILRLKNVERGELELSLNWIELPG